MENFNIERSRKILKQKPNRSGISTKHSQHERLKNVSAIRRREMVRRCVRYGYYYYFFHTFFTSACAGWQVAIKGRGGWGVEDGRGLNIKTLKKKRQTRTSKAFCISCTAPSTFISLFHQKCKSMPQNRTAIRVYEINCAKFNCPFSDKANDHLTHWPSLNLYWLKRGARRIRKRATRSWLILTEVLTLLMFIVSPDTRV